MSQTVLFGAVIQKIDKNVGKQIKLSGLKRGGRKNWPEMRTKERQEEKDPGWGTWGRGVPVLRAPSPLPAHDALRSAQDQPLEAAQEVQRHHRRAVARRGDVPPGALPHHHRACGRGKGLGMGVGCTGRPWWGGLAPTRKGVDVPILI